MLFFKPENKCESSCTALGARVNVRSELELLAFPSGIRKLCPRVDFSLRIEGIVSAHTGMPVPFFSLVL